MTADMDPTIALRLMLARLWTETNPTSAGIAFYTSIPDQAITSGAISVQEVPHRIKSLGPKHLMQPAELTTASHAVHVFVKFDRSSHKSVGTSKQRRYNMVEQVKTIIRDNPSHYQSSAGIAFYLCGERPVDETQFEPPVLHTVIEVSALKID